MYRPATTRLTEKDEGALRQLNLLNRFGAVLFLAVSLFFVIDTAQHPNQGFLPLFVSWYQRDVGAQTVLVDSDVYLGYFSFVFTLLACLDHAWVGWNGRTVYEAGLAQGVNPFRWTEYFFSASLMQVLIAMLCGVQDVLLLLAVGVLMALCMVFGWLAEVDPVRARTHFWLGCLPFLASWAIVFSSFGLAAHHAEDMPDFVYAATLSLVGLHCLFAYNQWRDVSYLKRERAFILLSPTAKLLLAFITWGGIRSL